MISKPVYQLTLDCGHVAFALAEEDHELGRPRPCYACGTPEPPIVWERIIDVKVLQVLVPEGGGRHDQVRSYAA